MAGASLPVSHDVLNFRLCILPSLFHSAAEVALGLGSCFLAMGGSIKGPCDPFLGIYGASSYNTISQI